MKSRKIIAAAVSVVAVFALAACSDDDEDNNDATPTPTVTESVTADPTPTAGEQGEPFDLVCPPPIGTVKITTDESDQWAPGIVVGTGKEYYPVAFGPITFTDTATGEVYTEPATTLTGADTTGAVECTFSQTVDDVDEGGNPVHGLVAGTVSVVTVKPTVTASPTLSPTASPTTP
jgi:hypothetical protein